MRLTLQYQSRTIVEIYTHTAVRQSISHLVFFTVIHRDPAYDEIRSSNRGFEGRKRFVRQPWHRRESLEFDQRRRIRLVWKEQWEERVQLQLHVDEHGLSKIEREFNDH